MTLDERVRTLQCTGDTTTAASFEQAVVAAVAAAAAAAPPAAVDTGDDCSTYSDSRSESDDYDSSEQQQQPHAAALHAITTTASGSASTSHSEYRYRPPNQSPSSVDMAELVPQLMEIGFPQQWCTLALRECHYDVAAASTWIVDHIDMLSTLSLSLNTDDTEPEGCTTTGDDNNDAAYDEEQCDEVLLDSADDSDDYEETEAALYDASPLPGFEHDDDADAAQQYDLDLDHPDEDRHEWHQAAELLRARLQRRAAAQGELELCEQQEELQLQRHLQQQRQQRANQQCCDEETAVAAYAVDYFPLETAAARAAAVRPSDAEVGHDAVQPLAQLAAAW
eukprot:4973-Heterococcus_DN1.PRE.1